MISLFNRDIFLKFGIGVSLCMISEMELEGLGWLGEIEIESVCKLTVQILISMEFLWEFIVSLRF